LQEPGTFIEGKYEIIEKIREGGMGSIYKVRHRLLEEIRVVKVMKPQVLADEELKHRFAEEARTATRLKHPNICTIHDFALDDDGTAYLVMEFIEGLTLAELLRTQGPPGLAMTLQIAHQALLALGYLHRRNVVHRDIAPDNLMLTYDEEGNPRVKLIDLGIAKALDRPAGELTSTGVFLGKLKYASPEQYGALTVGEKIDGRSDLYSLGVVLYELLTDRRPFLGDTPAELLRAHLFVPPAPFSETDPQGRVPEELRAVILKSLEKKRDDRFATAEEFDREIVSLMHRFDEPGPTDPTVQILSSLHASATLPRDVTVTPSAQDRLDRQFGAQATPRPSGSSAGRAGAPIAPVVPLSRAPEPPKAAAQRAPSRVVLWLGLAAAIGILVIAVAAMLRSRGGGPPAREVPSATPVAAQPAAAPAVPTPAPKPPEVTPAIAENVQPTPPPAVSPSSDDGRARRQSEVSRDHMLAARASADRAKAPRLASSLYAFARQRQARGQELFSKKDFAGSRVAFEAAAAAYSQAESLARVPAQHPEPEKIAAGASPLLTEPSRPAAAPPTAVPAPIEPPRVVPAPAEPAHRAAPSPSDAERIRETVARYARAQSTLDPDLYAQVYPSIDRARIRAAFEELRSQTLEFDVKSIEVSGTTAIVRGYEKRSFVPRVGSEQRVGADRTIRLEKRGDAWVITRLN
jgi:serine/threonine-protein kinase